MRTQGKSTAPRFNTGLALVLTGALLATPALAQEPETGAPQAAPRDDEEREVITVIGRRLPNGMTLHDYALEFVIDIADPPGSNRGFAAWGDRICVGVVEAPAHGAQLIADRISDVARDLGLDAGEPGCTPNILVLFTTDGAALASRLVEERPRMFRPFGGAGGTTQGLAALEDFKASNAPVRWWQVTVPVDSMGRAAILINRPSSSFTGPLGAAPVVAGANSHISNGVQDEIWTTYVIVDATKVDGLAWTQLADYLAMVSLAQLDPKASAGGYDSILNLFESPSSVDGLTDWDRSYLTALYALDRRLMPSQQRGALAGLIARDQRSTGTE